MVVAASAALTASESDAETISIRLLADLRDAFAALGERASSAALIEHLLASEGAPWPEFNRGRPISPTTLARILRPFGVRPVNVRERGAVFKGYVRESFAEAWRRYLDDIPSPNSPESPASSRYTATMAENGHFSDVQAATPKGNVADRKSENSSQDQQCSGVADELPQNGVAGERYIPPSNKAGWNTVI